MFPTRRWADLLVVLLLPASTACSKGSNPASPAVEPLSWVQTSGPPGGSLYSIAIQSNGQIFAGTNAGGVFRSRDVGETWVAVSSGLTNLQVRAVASHPRGDMYAGTDAGLFRSTDDGDSWMLHGIDFPVRALAMRPNGDVFAGTFGQGIFRSTDRGDTWTAAGSGVTNPFILALGVRPNGDVFAGTNGGGAFRSTDRGDTWAPVNGITHPVLAFAIRPNGDGFAGTNGGACSAPATA